ncbi:hypothetical protein [Phocaeicola plebeius]|uniref:hypothetical protein n=1 Tax=Phocaeicola plebeius TaxID=310297 RepID=UPI00307D9899
MVKIRSKILGIIIAVIISVQCSAQVQQGFVRTIGRPNKPGVVLEGVVIRVQGLINSVVTSSEGKFHLSVPDKKDGDALVLLSVRKNGYELKDKELIGRSLIFSSQVPIEILMVDMKQLIADKERIEKKAYQVAEHNYQKKLREIESQIKNREITAEKYRKKLQELQENYEKYLSLISDMADRYARTDYDQLDSIDYKISLCIENGELDKADSLIHTVFDPEKVLERNRLAKEEIQQRIAFAQSIIDKAKTDKEAIKRDKLYAERMIEFCDKLSREYLVQGEFFKALNCLEKSLEIKMVLYGVEDQKTKTAILQIDSLKMKL